MTSPPPNAPDDAPTPGAGRFEQLAALWRLTVDRPVATLMVVVAVSVFGYLSYGQLALALMPELSYPTLTVRTEYEGAAPQEVEEELSKRLEEVLRTVEGVVAIESASRPGMSDVVLQFHWDTDMDFASQRVRERVDVLTLPEGSDKPLLLRYDPSLDPILRLGLSGGKNLAELRTVAQDEIARELEKVKGVAMVRVRGGREEVVRIDLNQERMSQLGLSLEAVQQRLTSENVNLAGGQLRQGEVEYLVRTLNEFGGLDELERMVVARKGDSIVRLGQIARVYYDNRDREVATHIQGDESVEIAVYKEADANLVQVATTVRDKLLGTDAQRAYVAGLKSGEIKPPGQEAKKEAKDDAESGAQDAAAGRDGDKGGQGNKGQPKGKGAKGKDAKAKAQAKRMEAMKRRAQEREHAEKIGFIANTLPDGMNLEVLSDQSRFIQGAIDEVTSTALLGALFAVLVLYVFLRSPYSTLIIAVAIPLSVVFTFAPMRVMGLTLNIMSLGGLALGIGMLVDNSIVVLESIFRCREEGDDLRRSAIRGAQEVGGAVIASTLTTTAVFFPIVFVEGVAGQLFGDLALTVVFSLLASLIVALFVVPMLASRDLMALAQPSSEADAPEPSGDGPTSGAQRGRLAQAWRARLGVWTSLESGKRDVMGLWRWLKAPPRWALAWRGLLALIALGYVVARSALMFVLELTFAKLVLGGFVGLLWLVRLVGIAVGAVFGLLLSPVLWVFDKGFDLLSRAYGRILRGALRQRALVLLVSVGLLAAALASVDRLGMELIPELHQGAFKAELRMPIGTNLEETELVVRQIETKLDTIDGIASHSSVIGAERTATSDGDRGEHSATVAIELDTKGVSDIETLERRAMRDVRAVLATVPGLQYELARPTLFTLQTPIRVEIRGYNLTLLARVADQVQKRMSGLPDLTDVRSNLRSGYPEVQITFQRDRLAQHGLTIRDVAQVVQRKIRGTTPSDLRRDQKRLDILLRVQRDQVATVEDLNNLIVGYASPPGSNNAGNAALALPSGGGGGGAAGGLAAALGGGGDAAGLGGGGARLTDPSSGAPITLGAVATIRIAEGPSEIRHLDGQRAALVDANSQGLDLRSITDAIQREVDAIALPRGFSLVVGGQNREMEQAQRSMLMALILAVFLVYVVMASQFESILAPLVIIFTIPLALIGVVGALWLAQTPLSVVVFIGLIMLAGIVVNNAIVLVDYILQLRQRGLDKREAIAQACQVRLRPVLITTLTTVLGLMPMALGLGEGAEIRTPMALTVIAGLTSSTLLTLLVIPVVYDVIGELGGAPAPEPQTAENNQNLPPLPVKPDSNASD